MRNRQRILVATRNRGKIAELDEFLSAVGITPVGLDRFGDVEDVAETGSTFTENARVKAAGYALQTGMMSLGDDSGLEVAALDGRPGVLSARYGGEDIGFRQKMEMLIAELDKTGDDERRARFVCSLAIADESGRIVFSTEGICEGTIASEPRGTHGFGYDPIFIPDGYNATFGELEADVKQEISHRRRAFRQIVPFLRGFLSIAT